MAIGYSKGQFHVLNRGYREALDGRLCRPDSEQRPLVSNFSTMAIVKLCCHNFTQIANLMIFFVSTISYRPTDLSLLKEFSKNVIFSNSYNLPSQSAIQNLSISTDRLNLPQIWQTLQKMTQQSLWRHFLVLTQVCGDFFITLKKMSSPKLINFPC